MLTPVSRVEDFEHQDQQKLRQQQLQQLEQQQRRQQQQLQQLQQQQQQHQLLQQQQQQQNQQLQSVDQSDLQVEAITEEISKTMAGLTPSPFQGRAGEDGRGAVFLKPEAWLILSKITENRNRVAATGLLLKGTARLWFESLAEDITFEALKTQFRSRFATNQITKWRDLATMWEMRQAEGQSTDEFITLVEARGARCGMSDE